MLSTSRQSCRSFSSNVTGSCRRWQLSYAAAKQQLLTHLQPHLLRPWACQWDCCRAEPLSIGDLQEGPTQGQHSVLHLPVAMQCSTAAWQMRWRLCWLGVHLRMLLAQQYHRQYWHRCSQVVSRKPASGRHSTATTRLVLLGTQQGCAQATLMVQQQTPAACSLQRSPQAAEAAGVLRAVQRTQLTATQVNTMIPLMPMLRLAAAAAHMYIRPPWTTLPKATAWVQGVPTRLSAVTALV